MALLHGAASFVAAGRTGALDGHGLEVVTADLLDGDVPAFVAELEGDMVSLASANTAPASVEAATLALAHWTEDVSGGLDHPLRARGRLLERAPDLEEMLGPRFASAVIALVRSDAPWTALADPTLPARMSGQGDTRPLPDLALAAGRAIDRTREDPGRAWRVSALAREMAILAALPRAAIDDVRVAASLIGASRLARRGEPHPPPARISTALLVEAIPGCEVLAGWLDALERSALGRDGVDDGLPLEASILAAADLYCSLRAHGARDHRATDALRRVEAERGRSLDSRATAQLRPALERLARRKRWGVVGRRG